MPPRAFGTQQVLLGRETVPGTAVPAVIRPMAMTIPPTPTFESERFSPQGYTAPTLSIVNQEWAEADVEGRLTYTDAGLVFASAIGKPVTDVPTATPVATLAKRHRFVFDGLTQADPQTYTVEHGDATLARRFKHGFFNGFDLNIARDALEFSSAMMGQQVETGVALTTAGVTVVEPIPIAAGQWDVYVDDTAAAIGTTKFLDAYEAELAFGERFDPVWPINSALKSFGGIVEKAADDQEHTGMLNIGASASMEGYLDTLRRGEKKFVRLVATGPTIEGAIKYLMQIDFCCFITETDGYTDLNSLLVLPFSYQVGRDEAWIPITGGAAGCALMVTLINTVPAF